VYSCLCSSSSNRFGNCGIEGDDDAVEALLAKGADVNAKGTLQLAGMTALQIVVENGRTAAMAALLAKRADPNARTTNGFTALDFAERERHSAINQSLKNANNPK
jgi:ankyrin repeat protein